MKVEQLMTRTVRTCHPDDRLDTVARIMWEEDCGCVPVVHDDEGGVRVAGMVTDRDICMAAYTQGRPLAELTVRSAMSREVCACGAAEPLAVALKILRTNQLHRLPVVDAHGYLVGLLSLADVAREAARRHGRRAGDVTDADVAEALEAICRPRSPRDVLAA